MRSGYGEILLLIILQQLSHPSDPNWRISWYLCLMPIWIKIADFGQQNMLDFAAKEALKSPSPLKPLGIILRNLNQQRHEKYIPQNSFDRAMW
jgi:hypothetical protein